jgi:hypothetical protein
MEYLYVGSVYRMLKMIAGGILTTLGGGASAHEAQNWIT